MTLDVFISHASADKLRIARPLKEKLEAAGYTVWLDESGIELGDSLSREIDRGIDACRCAVVVLSPAFKGRWPEYELARLLRRETAEARRICLPVWHGLTDEQATARFPALADRLAARTTERIDSIVERVHRLLQRDRTPEAIRRDIGFEVKDHHATLRRIAAQLDQLDPDVYVLAAEIQGSWSLIPCARRGDGLHAIRESTYIGGRLDDAHAHLRDKLKFPSDRIVVEIRCVDGTVIQAGIGSAVVRNLELYGEPVTRLPSDATILLRGRFARIRCPSRPEMDAGLVDAPPIGSEDDPVLRQISALEAWYLVDARQIQVTVPASSSWRRLLGEERTVSALEYRAEHKKARTSQRR